MNHYPETDLENEIRLKRLSPEYLYDLIMHRINLTRADYQQHYKTYRDKIRTFDADFEALNNYYSKGIAAAKKSMDLLKESLEAIDNADFYEKTERILDPVVEFNEIEFDDTKWMRENGIHFKTLHADWLILNDKSKTAAKALKFLVKGRLSSLMISGLIFALSFVLSFFLESYLEGKLSFVGEILAKLGTSFMFYVVVDWLIDQLKIKFVWRKISMLLEDLNSLDSIVKRQGQPSSLID